MKRLIFALAFAVMASSAMTKEKDTCRSLDTREFGLVSDGSITEPWSEVKLIERYGPPCLMIELGEVYIERSRGLIVELGPKTLLQGKLKAGTLAVKKQFIYKGDYSNPTTVFTIVDGVVVRKERIR
jgi:hypothetical protein